MAEPLSEPTPERWYCNPTARSWSKPSPSPKAGANAAGAAPSPLTFHRQFPSYAPTRLVSLPSVASRLGVRSVFIKDESSRLGLPAFKILGASWAVFLALCEKMALDPLKMTLESLQAAVVDSPVVLVAATDGNHGRAVARMARLLNLKSEIYVPEAVSAYSRECIASEGAVVTVVNGSYDEAVRTASDAAAAAPSTHLLIQDTSWPGYEKVPAQIVSGYTTLFAEIDSQLAELALPSPALVVVPVGVGSLAHAATLHYRQQYILSTTSPTSPSGPSTPPSHSPPPSILSVEPTNAPCLLTSLLAGEARSISTSQTIMPGFNCGTPSPLAWGDLLAGVDAAVSIRDEQAVEALDELRALGVDAGPCGAATLAALHEVISVPTRKDALQLKGDAVVVLISTEGSGVFVGGKVAS